MLQKPADLSDLLTSND